MLSLYIAGGFEGHFYAFVAFGIAEMARGKGNRCVSVKQGAERETGLHYILVSIDIHCHEAKKVF